VQIFNQNPRAWKPGSYTDEQVAAYREALGASQVEALVIHAVYLINCASEDPDFVQKSLASLVGSLRAGAALGARGVVLHAGSALKDGGDVDAAVERAAGVLREALAESDGCALHLEDTAGAGGTLGRSFGELAALLEAAGGDARLGVCLDSCHLLASGFDVRTPAGVDAVLEDFDREVGLDRLGSLHLNDSQAPLGSNRDRHAALGAGELGEEGCAAFLSAPAFDELPCVLETPGDGGYRASLELARELRERGRTARGLG
jgi:deoxyribonuclease-4